MRTTLTIDDQLVQELKELAHRAGKPFKEVVNETLREGLRAKRGRPAKKPYKLTTVALGVRGGLNLDKALAIADTLEDQEIVRELRARE